MTSDFHLMMMDDCVQNETWLFFVAIFDFRKVCFFMCKASLLLLKVVETRFKLSNVIMFNRILSGRLRTIQQVCKCWDFSDSS